MLRRGQTRIEISNDDLEELAAVDSSLNDQVLCALAQTRDQLWRQGQR